MGAVGAFEGVLVAEGVGVTEKVFAGAEGSTFSLNSPYSFHSSTSARSCRYSQHILLPPHNYSMSGHSPLLSSPS